MEKGTASIFEAFSLSGQDKKECAEIFEGARAKKVEMRLKEPGPRDRKSIIAAVHQVLGFLRDPVFVRFPDRIGLYAKAFALQAKYFSVNERFGQKRENVRDIGNGHRLF